MQGLKTVGVCELGVAGQEQATVTLFSRLPTQWAIAHIFLLSRNVPTDAVLFVEATRSLTRLQIFLVRHLWSPKIIISY